MKKNIHIFGGGTIEYITNHFAVCAPAYGTTANKLAKLCEIRFSECSILMELTKMAGGVMETQQDVFNRITELKKSNFTKIIFLNTAFVDYIPNALYSNDILRSISFGNFENRLESRDGDINVQFKPTSKVVNYIRTDRKDIFLIAFKTTCNATKQEMYEKGLRLCKEGSANLVLVNDVVTKWNMIITPEEAVYHETDNRNEVLKQLVDMVYYRSQLTFTQSTVVSGQPVSWDDSRIPFTLKTVVNHCINANAYKAFNNATVGHFAVKLSDTEFLTSIRRSNFNNLDKIGMVYVKTDGPDTVLAYGAKPSVGGQSQRIVFKDHPGTDCIVHFHSPFKDNHPDNIQVKSQREVECGSHQCGQNTSNGLTKFGNLYAVMLDNHGPNIVFNHDINPQEVIDFIDRNFDLSKKTGGYNL